jgi:hypothetical protein
MTPPRNKSLLAISFQFGELGETGGFRWAKTVPYFAEAGWSTTVLTRDAQPQYLHHDMIDVVSIPHWQPATRSFLAALRVAKAVRLGIRKLTSKGGRRDGNIEPTASRTSGWDGTPDTTLRERAEQLRLPRPSDPRPLHGMLHRLCESLDLVFWAFRAYRQAIKMSRGSGTHWDVVVVSSPPHWTQLCGAWLSGRLRIPFIADLRDPWCTALPADCASDSVLARLDLRIERRIQRAASLVVFNTTVAQKLSRECPSSAPGLNSTTIGNGYDGETIHSSAIDTECFRILFAGHIYSHMDIRVLLRAAARLAVLNELKPGEMSVELLGAGEQFNEIPYTTLARAYGIEAFLKVSPRVGRDQALEYQSRSSVLVAMDYPYPCAIVMKVYDYLCMPGFLLALTPPGTALSAMLAELGLPSFALQDEDKISAYLQTCFDRWREGDFPGPKDPEQRYNRARRTQEMLSAIEKVVSSARQDNP